MSQVHEVIIRFLAGMLKIPYKTVGKFIGRLSNSYLQVLWRVKLKEVGNGTRIGQYVMIHGAQNVSLGANISIAEFVHIWGNGGVEIRDNTVIVVTTRP